MRVRTASSKRSIARSPSCHCHSRSPVPPPEHPPHPTPPTARHRIRSDTNPSTLTRFILSKQREHPEATGDLTLILSAIATATKAITAAVRRAGLASLTGLHGASNSSGDDQKKLDIVSNDIFRNLLASTGVVAVMVSEEDEEAIVLKEFPRARYVVAFDPLDGSSNIDCNVSVGSIFSIFRRASLDTPASAADALQRGRDVVCARYSAYGSSTQLCVAFAEDHREQRGVNVFTLDPSIGEFLLSHAALKIPAAPQRIYSCNEGSLLSFPPFLQAFVAQCKAGPKPFTARYVGSMVADVHRTISECCAGRAARVGDGCFLRCGGRRAHARMRSRHVDSPFMRRFKPFVGPVCARSTR